MAGAETAMDVKMLVATLPDDVNLAEWCRRLGISRQTAYKWRRRFREEGVEGLSDRSRAPRRPTGWIGDALEQRIGLVRKELIDQGFDAGPASIQARLALEGGRVVSEATIWRVLRRRGWITMQPQKRPKASYRRFERDRPNECWQIDATHTTLADGRTVEIINVIDDCSRLCVHSVAVENTTSNDAWETIADGARRLGWPTEILHDNARYFRSPDGFQLVVFQRMLDRLGIRDLHSRPAHPQTCGKIERFHQTQGRWLAARPAAATLTELQELLDECRDVYNTRRPHRALSRRTPADVWASLPKAEPIDITTDRVVIVHRHVDSAGNIGINGHLYIGLGAAWAHTPVTVIRRGDEATVIHTTTGEILRELQIDPNRRYQPTGNPPGGPRQPRRNRQP